MTTRSPSLRTTMRRWLWFASGWAAVAVGTIGIVVPGLPSTVFFIIAAACFARSSPRFERWVLELPRIGPVVRDYRAGLGMPRRAKVFAVSAIVFFSVASAVMSRGRPVVASTITGLGLIGAWYVLAMVPTRERVLGAGIGEDAAVSDESSSPPGS